MHCMFCFRKLSPWKCCPAKISGYMVYKLLHLYITIHVHVLYCTCMYMYVTHVDVVIQCLFTLCLYWLLEITYQYRAITNTDAVGPVTCLAPVGHMILAATGNKVVGVSALTESHKDQLELDGHHQIIEITVSEQLVCLALRDSLLVFMCTFGKDGTLEPLCTMDCTNPVLSMLKSMSTKSYTCTCTLSFIHVCIHVDSFQLYVHVCSAHTFRNLSISI